MLCSSLAATLTFSSGCRAFIEYLNSRKTYQPSHRAIFSEHPGGKNEGKSKGEAEERNKKVFIFFYRVYTLSFDRSRGIQ